MFRRSDLAVASESAEVVYAFEDDDPSDAGRGKHIAVETRQHIRPQPIGQKMIAADALIGNANAARGG